MLAASPTIRVWRCGDVTNKLHGKEATMSTNNKKIKKRYRYTFTHNGQRYEVVSRKSDSDAIRKLKQKKLEVITTIIDAHMNKRSWMGGSYRIADSSEIRNAARNVLIIGEAEPGLNYCDHDKCNVSTRSDTILYTYDERRMPQFVRFTDKTDRDFQRQLLQGGNTKKLEIAKDLIISSLMENGSLSGEELELRVVTDEISQHTYQRARASLINSKVIVMHRDCNKHTTYSLITD